MQGAGHPEATLCSEVLVLPRFPQVPTAHGKADLTNYRSEGSKVSTDGEYGQKGTYAVAAKGAVTAGPLPTLPSQQVAPCA